MFDQREKPHDFLDDLPESLKKKVLLLRGLRLLSKEVPNLPEGKLRDSVLQDTQSLLTSVNSSKETIQSLKKRIEELEAENIKLCKRFDEIDSYDRDTSRAGQSSSKFWIIAVLVVVCILIFKYYSSIPGEATIPDERIDSALKPRK